MCWEYLRAYRRAGLVACAATLSPCALWWAWACLLPAAVIGVLTIKTIKFYLFNAVAVAVALVVGAGDFVGGVAPAKAAHYPRGRYAPARRAESGLCPGVSLIPGVSRSA